MAFLVTNCNTKVMVLGKIIDGISFLMYVTISYYNTLISFLIFSHQLPKCWKQNKIRNRDNENNYEFKER